MADDDLLADFDDEPEAGRDPRHDAERDGVAAMHDVEYESGDEECLPDLFAVDRKEARALGVALDPLDGDERLID